MATFIEETDAYKFYTDLVQARLPERKAAHSLSVARMMLQIVPMLGLDVELGVTAGLLHDLCRTMSAEELLAKAKEYGLPINEVQAAHPMLLHGPVAAEECRRSLNILDEEVYEAIYFHTTGRPFIRAYGQALYLADFSEPLRKYDQAATARGILAKDGFEKALLFAAEQKYKRVQESKHQDPETQAFYEWLHLEYA